MHRDIKLTERELQVAAMTACGLSEKAIAMSLSISPNTVRVHVENIKRRLGAKNKALFRLDVVR